MGGMRMISFERVHSMSPCLCMQNVQHQGLSSLRTTIGHRKIPRVSIGRRVHSQLQLSRHVQESEKSQETSIPDLIPFQSQQKPSVINDLWQDCATKYPNTVALLDPHAPIPCQYTFEQIQESISHLASGFASLSIAPGDTISIFSENSSRWFISDQACMRCGAIDAVRGISSTPDELLYILRNSQSSALILQDATVLDKLIPDLLRSDIFPNLKFIMLLWGSYDTQHTNALPPLFTFDDILQRGIHHASSFLPSPHTASDVATIVYTSGTTGRPKGIPLTHKNIMSQIQGFPDFVKVNHGQTTMSMLPPWHIYERTASYYILSSGLTQIYTSVRYLKDDLATYSPDFFVCVPLVLDTLHSRTMTALNKASAIRKALATGLLAAAVTYIKAQRVVLGLDIRYARCAPSIKTLFSAWMTFLFFKPLYFLFQRLVASKIRSAIAVKDCIISGGGSLAPHLDDFYEAIGVTVLNGWGLTETSPVLACRSKDKEDGNVRGSVGLPIQNTVLRIVAPEDVGVEVEDGQQGLILAKGPGVMSSQHLGTRNTSNESHHHREQGSTYNKNDIFVGSDGWFNTGDLGWRAPLDVPRSNMGGVIVLTGRAKDTIVLSSGENVEPAPIEDSICRSPYVKCALLVGQGHRALGALIQVDEAAAKGLLSSSAQYHHRQGNVQYDDDDDVHAVVHDEIKKALKEACKGRVRWERVTAYEVLKEPLSFENGTLTRTMKPRRDVIVNKHREELERLLAKLR